MIWEHRGRGASTGSQVRVQEECRLQLPRRIIILQHATLCLNLAPLPPTSHLAAACSSCAQPPRPPSLPSPPRPLPPRPHTYLEVPYGDAVAFLHPQHGLPAPLGLVGQEPLRCITQRIKPRARMAARAAGPRGREGWRDGTGCKQGCRVGALGCGLWAMRREGAEEFSPTSPSGAAPQPSRGPNSAACRTPNPSATLLPPPASPAPRAAHVEAVLQRRLFVASPVAGPLDVEVWLKVVHHGAHAVAGGRHAKHAQQGTQLAGAAGGGRGERMASEVG